MMQYYPTFTREEIGNMTLTEWKQRIKAHRFAYIEAESLFYQIPFIQQLTTITDKDGYYKYKSLKEIGIDLEQQKSAIDGKAKKKVNKYIQLHQRAERARKLAKQQLEKQKGGN